jgi:hypothetical protein
MGLKAAKNASEVSFYRCSVGSKLKGWGLRSLEKKKVQH